MCDDYAVKDLVVATYIAYKKVKMSKPYDPKTKSWIFENKDNVCAQLELDVRNGIASVYVLDYEALRRNLLGMVGRG